MEPALRRQREVFHYVSRLVRLEIFIFAGLRAEPFALQPARSCVEGDLVTKRRANFEPVFRIHA
jgi:hypothetical protein